MNLSSLTSAPKSVSRKTAVALFSALALAASGTFVYAASTKADFAITATPATQTIAQGQVASVVLVLAKQNGFTNPVSMTVSGVPPFAKASFSPNPIVVGQSPGDSSTLTIQTNVGGTTPAGSYPLTLTGTSGSLVHSASSTLTVQPATTPNFALTATPATQSLIQSDDTNYGIDLSRSGGFANAVGLTATGLPAGATATFSPASIPAGTASGSSTLVVSTAATTPTGTYAVTITGSGQIGASAASRTATVTLVVQKNAGFPISGVIPGPLELNQTVPIDLAISNPNNIDLKVTSITATVQNATSKAGCSGAENYKVTQMAASAFPLVLASGATKKLSELGVAPASFPTVQMVNLPKNQDACLGATFTLAYSGLATKK